MGRLKIGFVGVGNISGVYFQNLLTNPYTEIVAVSDLDLERAKAAAEKHNVPLALRPDELLAHPDVELVLNLTVPKAHVPVGLQAIQAGKHVYAEKPLGVNLEEGKTLIAAAAEAGLRVGMAPDTFLGEGIQTAIRAVNTGLIGEPIAGNAFMLCRGHETWHPSPEFYYEVGGGPMLDMGPYYLTALVALLGPIRRISGSARASFPTRTITSEPKRGKVVEVETPTHLAGVIDFQNGAVVHLTTSFDVYGSPLPNIVVYGSEGTLIVPDPNGFGGDVLLKRGNGEFEKLPTEHKFTPNQRGLGVIDLALAIQEGRPHRASGDLALHVLEAMLAFEKSSTEDRHIHLGTPGVRPEPMPLTAF